MTPQPLPKLSGKESLRVSMSQQLSARYVCAVLQKLTTDYSRGLQLRISSSTA